MPKRRTFALILTLLMIPFLAGCAANAPDAALSGSNATGSEISTADGKTSRWGTAESLADNSQDNSTKTDSRLQGPSDTAQEKSSLAASSQAADSTALSSPVADTSLSTPSIATSASAASVSSSEKPAALAATMPAPDSGAPQQTNPAAAKQASEPVADSVVISINCKTAVAKGMREQKKYQGIIPADGVILPPLTVEIAARETAFSLLKKVAQEHKIQLAYKGNQESAYIQAINNLYEFDGGPLSGWVFLVNGESAGYGCGKYKLNNGDIVVWAYTCNMGKDLK